MDIHELDAYEIIEERPVADVDSYGYVLRHKKSGARVAVLSNDDSNKVFYIGFKTPPEDGCGVPHIIEHTVLCGSDKFPVKDPFVELAKGSLNTFLNAMTYPDKTVYPVAGYNDKDFEHLMDVYLDAVFHPNITKYREIFMQEGWHYELENADAPLTVNGVVYNEMKGAYSSPDELLDTAISEALFPDNAYSGNYGGDPKQIPNLQYETYIDFYRRHYHPSNSYIYLYGDMDVAERLDWMDRAYLSEFDAQEVDSTITPQAPFDSVARLSMTYPIASDELEEDRTYLSYSKVIGTCTDALLVNAFNVLDYALISAPGAPVRQALIDAGIGQDVYSSYDTSRQQPVFSIIAKNANAGDEDRFLAIIDEQLQKLVDGRINRQSLLAGINSEEFRFRESDFGHFPKGLLYGLQCLDSWIFDEAHPFLQVECLDIYARLRGEIDSGFFEQLVDTYLLKNTHGAYVSIVPEKGAGAKEEARLAAQLADYKASLSAEEIEQLVEQTAHLKEYQAEPSSEEDLRKIPLLTRADLKREAEPFSNIEEQIGGVQVVRHDVAAHGIVYLNLLFDAKDVPAGQLGLLGLLRTVLGNVDTEHYSYADLSNEINIYTGGLSGTIGVYPSLAMDGRTDVRFEYSIKVLEENLPKALELAAEVLLRSKFADYKRLQELVAQVKARLQGTLSNSGHTVASYRALSRTSVYAYYQDAIYGIAYYQSIAKLDERVRTQPEVVAAQLQELVQRLFVRARLLVSYTADTATYQRCVPVLETALGQFVAGEPAGAAAVGLSDLLLPNKKGKERMAEGNTSAINSETVEPVENTGIEETSGKNAGREIAVKYKNEGSDTATLPLEPYGEGFCDASQIQYVARCGNFARHGYAFSGVMRIVRILMSYDYLWIQLRVIGGAYGCMNQFMRTGETYFVSYRDPNLARTNEVYEGIPEYLRTFAPDERDMTKYIIGTFGEIDVPQPPEGQGTRSMNAWLQGLTLEQLQKERNEILDAQPQDIRALADLVQAVLDDGQLCVIGNEGAIKAEPALFDTIQGLYQVDDK